MAKYYLSLVIIFFSVNANSFNVYTHSEKLIKESILCNEIQIEDAYLNDCMSININQLIGFIDNMRINAPYATLTFYHNGNQITGPNYFQLIGNMISIMQELENGAITVTASEPGYTDKTVSLFFSLGQYIPVFTTMPTPIYTPCLDNNQSYNLTQAEIKSHLQQFLTDGQNAILEINQVGGFSIMSSSQISFQFRIQGETCWSHNFSLQVIRIGKPVIDTQPNNYDSNCENTFTVSEQILTDSFGWASVHFGYEIKYQDTPQQLNESISLNFAGNDTTKVIVEFYYLSSPDCRISGILTIHKAPQINLDLTQTQTYLSDNSVIFCAGDNPSSKVNDLTQYIVQQHPGISVIQTTADIVQSFTNPAGQVEINITMPERCGQQTLYLSYQKNTIPILSITDQFSTCIGKTAILSATSNIGTIQWFNSENATEPIAQGNNFETPALFENTTYWINAINGSCVSQKTPIIVEIHPIIIPEFVPVAAICKDEQIAPLPLVSLNGITGSWSPDLNTSVTTTYIFTPDVGQCAENYGMTIIVNSINLTPTNVPQTIQECDQNNDQEALFNLQEVKEIINANLTENAVITFHETLTDANTVQNPIQNLNYTNNLNLTNNRVQLIWIRIQSANTGCSKILSINLEIHPTPKIYPIVNNAKLYSCGTFNLTDAGNEALGSQDTNIFNISYYTNKQAAEIGDTSSDNYIESPEGYTISIESQQIWIRIENVAFENCYAIGSFTLHNMQLSQPKITSKTGNIVCIDYISGKTISPVILSINENTKDILYTWYKDGIEIHKTNSTIYNVQEAGHYSVIATNSNPPNCTSVISENFEVISSGPATAIGQGYITEPFSDNISIEVLVEGYGEYEYSLDEDGPWQTDPIFKNVAPGLYTIYVKDILSDDQCGMLMLTNVAIVSYPRFFTPNNDGYNDFWGLKNLQSIDNCTVYIFNRYGKLLKELQPTSQNWQKKLWDGSYNGHDMPSGDYWFKAVFTYQGKKSEYKSHFSLIR